MSDELVGHMTKLIAAGLDRIEQLTGEVQRWQGMFDEKHNLMLEHKARAEKAEAERDRLRAALEDIADHDTGATAGLAYTAKIALKGETS